MKLLGTPQARLVGLGELAAEGVRDDVVRAAAGRVLGAAATPRERAAAIMRRVQALPYRPDPVYADGADEVFPVVWVLRWGGDCDDLVTAAAALDTLAGLRWRFVWLLQPGEALDHVSLEVWLEERWQWQEVTVAARLGESPGDAMARLGPVAMERLTGRA